MSLTVIPQLHLVDNYCYILIDEKTQKKAVIDPTEAKPVIDLFTKNNWNLDYVINTHHHWDHVGGNDELKSKFNSQLIAPIYDESRINNIDIKVSDLDELKLGESQFKVIHIPGHTSGQLAYWFYRDNCVFVGDTLFSLGCGRIEGTPGQMFESLNKLKALPPKTNIYFGHEYTEKNLSFALTLEPNSPALSARGRVVKGIRAKGLATTPCVLADELNENPFLRPQSPEIRQTLGLANATDLEVFTKIRKLKDQF